MKLAVAAAALVPALFLASNSLLHAASPPPSRIQIVAREYSFVLSRLQSRRARRSSSSSTSDRIAHDLRLQRQGSRHIAGIGTVAAGQYADLSLHAGPGAILALVLAREPSRARHERDPDRHAALIVDDVGDPAGVPVVYLHGGGDSRLSRHPDDGIAAALGIRLLAVDRSGPSGPGRTLLGFAGDCRGARRRARRRPVCRRRLVGRRPARAGGRRGAPERVTRVALVASMPLPDGVRSLSGAGPAAMRLARVSPRLAAAASKPGAGRRRPRPVDPDTDAAYARGRVESFRSGGEWLARELAYLGRPWGFGLAGRPGSGRRSGGASGDRVTPALDRPRLRSAGFPDADAPAGRRRTPGAVPALAGHPRGCGATVESPA